MGRNRTRTESVMIKSFLYSEGINIILLLTGELQRLIFSKVLGEISVSTKFFITIFSPSVDLSIREFPRDLFKSNIQISSAIKSLIHPHGPIYVHSMKKSKSLKKIAVVVKCE